MSTSTSSRDDRTARIIDRDVAPLWHDRFASLMWPHLPTTPVDLVLDVHAGSGRTTLELLNRLPGKPRIVALEPDAGLRELAKARLGQHKNRVYLKAGDFSELGEMSSNRYDLVVANLVLGDASNIEDALRELARVVRPGGHLLATLPLHGSWAEAQDLYREVLRDAGLPGAARRMRRLSYVNPTPHELARFAAEVTSGPQDFIVEHERFELLYTGGREFLFAPLIELGPLRLWKAVLGEHAQPQQLFWRLKESIDTYFFERIMPVTIHAGVLCLRAPSSRDVVTTPTPATWNHHWGQWPELDALWKVIEDRDRTLAEGSGIVLLEADLEPSSSASSLSGALLPADENSGLAGIDHIRGTLTAAPIDVNEDGSESEFDEFENLLDKVFEFSDPEDSENEGQPALVDPDSPESSHHDTLQRVRDLLPPPLSPDAVADRRETSKAPK